MTTEPQARAEAAEWLSHAPGLAMDPDGSYGLQCADVRDQYGIDLFQVGLFVAAGAGDAMTTLERANRDYYEVIRNDPARPDLVPQKGDVIVWGGSSANPYGHVAVVKSADRDGVTVVQQDGFKAPLRAFYFNDGTVRYYSQHPTHEERLGYWNAGTGMCAGWLRPKPGVVVYTGADTRGYGPAPATPSAGPMLWIPGAIREEQPGAVALDKSLPPRITHHITSDVDPGKTQPTIQAVGSYLKSAGYCPHLLVDPFTGEIRQYYPANVGARALAAWNEDGAAHIQVEWLFSRGAYRGGKQYWALGETPMKGLPEVLTLADSWGIPRAWPLGPTPPIGQSGNRDPKVWNTCAGHYGHSQVPNNDHTDPGVFPDITSAPALTTQSNTTITTTGDWFDMATEEQLRRIIKQEARDAVRYELANAQWVNDEGKTETFHKWLNWHMGQARAGIDSVPDRVWHFPITIRRPGHPDDGKQSKAITKLEWMDHEYSLIRGVGAKANATLAVIVEAVRPSTILSVVRNALTPKETN